MTVLARAPLAALLFVISVLLVAFQLMFQMLYIGPVPGPIGTVIVRVSLPWLVHATVTEISPTTAGGAAPGQGWVAAGRGGGLLGPGGAIPRPATWQSLLLLLAGAAAGLIAFRRAVENIAAADSGRTLR